MGRRSTIRLVLPVALAVTAIAVSLSCDDDGDDGDELALCTDVMQTGACEPCLDGNGDKDCAGAEGCYWDEEQGNCDQAVA